MVIHRLKRNFYLILWSDSGNFSLYEIKNLFGKRLYALLFVFCTFYQSVYCNVILNLRMESLLKRRFGIVLTLLLSVADITSELKSTGRWSEVSHVKSELWILSFKTICENMINYREGLHCGSSWLIHRRQYIFTYWCTYIDLKNFVFLIFSIKTFLKLDFLKAVSLIMVANCQKIKMKKSYPILLSPTDFLKKFLSLANFFKTLSSNLKKK